MHQLHQSFYKWNLVLGVVYDTRVERRSVEGRGTLGGIRLI